MLDYLRSASVLPTTKELSFEKDLAKDYFVRILKAQSELSILRAGSSLSEVDRVSGNLKKDLFELGARRFWIEKRSDYPLLPLKDTILTLTGLGGLKSTLRKAPACNKLY